MKLSDSQQRLLSVLKALAGHEISGLTNAQVARMVKTSESRSHGDLNNLKEQGLAEQLHDGKWRLGTEIVQIAVAHQEGLQAIERKLAEVKLRYGREA